LSEPLATLDPEQLAAAKALSITDAEIAQELKQCLALGRVVDLNLYGTPKTSDAAFLVALRNKLAEAEKEPVIRGLFGSWRLVGAVASVCVLMMAVIFTAGNQVTPQTMATMQTQDAQALESFASAIDPTAIMVPDSMTDASVDAESLAVYLDVPDLVSNWDFDTDTDQPLTDELLSLDPQTLQEVLNELEDTNFF
jgi:hypothetical protein